MDVMKNLRFGAVCLTMAMMVAQPAAAQDKAAEVVAAARAAIGGGALDGMKTFGVEARMARNVGDRQMSSSVEVLVEVPDKYVRIEDMTAPVARTMTSGFNGGTAIRPAGMSMGHGGAVMIVMGPGGAAPGAKMTPEQEAQLNATLLTNQRAEISRLMLGWFAMPHPALDAGFTYVGEAEAPDGKAHVIDVTSGDFAARLFIDQATSLPLMLTYQAPKPRVMTMRGPAPGGAGGRGGAQAGSPQADVQRQLETMRDEPPAMVEHRLYFSDWREVDGIRFPHVLQRAADGETVEEWEIARVRVNPKIDAKKFQ